MRRKATVWVIQAMKWRDYSREYLDKATKEKLLERNWISFNSSTKQSHKENYAKARIQLNASVGAEMRR